MDKIEISWLMVICVNQLLRKINQIVAHWMKVFQINYFFAQISTCKVWPFKNSFSIRIDFSTPTHKFRSQHASRRDALRSCSHAHANKNLLIHQFLSFLLFSHPHFFFVNYEKWTSGNFGSKVTLHVEIWAKK